MSSVQGFNTIFHELCLPSLEDAAVISLALGIMEQEEIKKLFLLHFSAKNPSSYSLSTKRIAKITSLCKSLNSPEIYERKLLCVVNWLRKQYFDWISFIVKKIPWENKFPKKKDFVLHIMNSVHWNNGVIDEKKSMHQVLSLENVNDDKSLVKMFVYSSWYCLENEIKNIWPNLSKDDQDNILEENGKYYSMLYWACKIKGNFKNYLESVSDYMKGKKYRQLRKISKEPKFYAFVIHVFEGTTSGVKYFFNELAGTDISTEHLIYIIEVYLREFGFGWRKNYHDADILYFILTQIDDDDRVKRIFNEFSDTFLKLSLEYWPWHKFFVTLVKMCSDSIDSELFFDLVKHLIDDIHREKADICLLKMLWKNMPSDVKKSFCVFISNKQKERDVSDLWEKMTIEIIDMLLRDEELRNILTPYENFGAVFELILAQQYDVLDYWLKKCLGSEEAIICYMENFIKTKATGIIKNLHRFTLHRVNEFIKWSFRFEDVFDRGEVLKVKDIAIELICVSAFVRGMKHKKWEDLQKFIDWIMRNRDDYEDSLITLKEKALEHFFKSLQVKFYSKDDFTNCFKFLQYKTTNVNKLKKVINEVSFNEGEICAEWLKNGDWESINIFLKALSSYGKDILKAKQDVFLYIFNNNKEADFEAERYCANIKKFPYWSLKKDPKMKKNVWEIKKLIIDNHAIKSIENCIKNNLSNGLNNILDCLFEEGDKCAKMVTDLKRNVIEKVVMEESFWEKEYHFLMLVQFINWGKEYNKMKKEIWDIKRHFIEHFKNNVRGKIIIDLVLGGEKNFISSLFEDEKSKSDFEKTLWDMKEFLLKKLINDDDHLLTCKLFEKFEEFNKFLNWNGFNEAEVQNLKKLIFDGKGADCCLNWIAENKFDEINHFLEWCIKNDNMRSKILNLKRKVGERVASKYSTNWNESYFQRLDKFLILHSDAPPKNLKQDLVEKFGVKSCGECLANGNLTGLKKFLIWAGVKTEELATAFKKKLLKEILDVKCIEYWGGNSYRVNRYEYGFHIALDKFLQEYWILENTDISSIKFDLMEVHFLKIFTKLLAGKKHSHLKNFLAWSFDNINSKFQPRVNKLTKKMFEKFGKEYCVLMLTKNDWEAVKKFWNLCFDNRTDIKNIKSFLWNFKKDCIDQTLKGEAEKGGKNGEDSRKDFWNCLDKFLSWGPAAPNWKKDIGKYKQCVIQQYGIDIIKRYFMNQLKNKHSSLKVVHLPPRYFLKFAFGTCYEDEFDNELFELKKKIIEALINIEYEALIEKDSFYKMLDETLKFNTDEYIVQIWNLKKSTVEVQGVELCIYLICQNNISALHRFHKWVNNFYQFNVLNFKQSVAVQLAGNLTLVYSWESFKSFLDYGLDLNVESDRDKYATIKNYVTESCGADICYNCILKSNWDEIPSFLKWGIEPLENENLLELKTRLIEKYGAEYCNSKILEDDWQKLETFLNWAFESHAKNIGRDQEIINLKIKSLDAEICYKNHLQTLSSFLEWGFTSKAQLDKFKKSILKKGHALNYFVTKQKYKSHKTFQLWFVNEK